MSVSNYFDFSNEKTASKRLSLLSNVVKQDLQPRVI